MFGCQRVWWREFASPCLARPDCSQDLGAGCMAWMIGFSVEVVHQLITFNHSNHHGLRKSSLSWAIPFIYRQLGTNPNHCHICAPSSKWWMLKSLQQSVRWADLWEPWWFCVYRWKLHADNLTWPWELFFPENPQRLFLEISRKDQCPSGWCATSWSTSQRKFRWLSFKAAGNMAICC